MQEYTLYIQSSSEQLWMCWRLPKANLILGLVMSMRFPYYNIFSLTNKESSYGDSLDKDDEKSPLLSGNSVNTKNGGIHAEVKEEQEQPKQRDFQTIRVPGSGQAVRKYNRQVDCVLQTTVWRQIFEVHNVHSLGIAVVRLKLSYVSCILIRESLFL